MCQILVKQFFLKFFKNILNNFVIFQILNLNIIFLNYSNVCICGAQFWQVFEYSFKILFKSILPKFADIAGTYYFTNT